MNSGKAYSIDFGLSLIFGSLLCDKQSININPIKCCHCMHIKRSYIIGCGLCLRGKIGECS